MNRRDLDLPGGSLSSIDFGGSGRDILMLHTPGLSYAGWTALAWELSEGTHPVAVDLPGHGTSTLGYTDHESVADHLAAAVGMLGLDRPLIVGQDASTFLALLLARRHPELASGVVSIDTSYALDRPRAVEYAEFFDTDAFQHELAERFALGRTFASEAECYLFIDAHAAAMREDWMLAPLEENFLHSVRREGDVWRLHPVPEVLRAAYHFDPAAPAYPCAGIYDGLQVPVCLLHCTEGFDVHLGKEISRLEATHPGVTVERLESGHFPQFSHPTELAQIIRRFLQRTEPAVEAQPSGFAD